MVLLRSLVCLFLLAPVLISAPAFAEVIPMIDAHSQMAQGLDENTIIPLMDEAGVNRTILSARNDRSPAEVSSFAAAHPDRITAAVRTKGKQFNQNKPSYYSLMDKQLENDQFQAMAEVLFYHAQKGKKAPEIEVYPNDPQAQFALKTCLERGWPLVVHIEFAAAKGKREKYMTQLEAMVAAHPDHPFAMIHMGQLEPDEVERLIRAHGNMYFITSHCNPVTHAKNSGQPWVNLFKGKSLAPEWQKLMETYPDRFILAFDNVWPENWGDLYLKQARLWRKVFAELPPDVAHAIAHKNAERLWNLPAIQ